ncbi:hypothetical protein B9Z55_022346 [Caenorhabditis nigoni]|uniref:Uncharacterized protein n=1 Tax=Caenorhabditis nigoni TaxID=1611254 RepID=A0A2G5SJU6_9PELO|nr:hypothetical protein B9Z55_022346 [Caenorhabditis nigoni]
METSEMLRSDSASLSEFEIIDDDGILSESENGGFPSRKNSVSDENEEKIVHEMLIESTPDTDQKQHLSMDEKLLKEALDLDAVSAERLASVLVLENFQTIDDKGKLTIDTTSLMNFLKTSEEPNKEKILVMVNWIDKLHIENKELQTIIDAQRAQGDGQVKKMSRSASVVSVASCWGLPDMEAFRSQQPHIEKMNLHSSLVWEARQEELKELEDSGQMTDKIRLDLHNDKYRFRYQLEDWNMFDRVQFEENRAESKKRRLRRRYEERPLSPMNQNLRYSNDYGEYQSPVRDARDRSPSQFHRSYNDYEENSRRGNTRSPSSDYRSNNNRYDNGKHFRSELLYFINPYLIGRRGDTRPSSPDYDSYNNRYDSARILDEFSRVSRNINYPTRGQRWIVSRDYSHTNDRRCVYCDNRHEHDQCPNTVRVVERLCHLVSSGKCTTCLKSRCNCSGDPYRCRYCRNFTDGLHHESLCPYVENVFSDGYHN